MDAGSERHTSDLDVIVAMRRGTGHLAQWSKLRVLADAQRELARALHDEVGRATLMEGLTWEQVGEAVGLPRETAFRQFNGGDMIVVVRAHQARRKPADLRKAEIAEQVREYLARHAQHVADADGGQPSCECKPYNDLIYDLPAFTPKRKDG